MKEKIEEHEDDTLAPTSTPQDSAQTKPQKAAEPVAPPTKEADEQADEEKIPQSPTQDDSFEADPLSPSPQKNDEQEETPPLKPSPMPNKADMLRYEAKQKQKKNYQAASANQLYWDKIPTSSSDNIDETLKKKASAKQLYWDRIPTSDSDSIDETLKKKASPKQLYWDKILTGDTDSIDEEVKKKAQPNTAHQDPDEQEERLLTIINRSWVVDHQHKSKQEVRQNWDSIRQELSQENKVGNNERELFLALSDKHREEKLSQIAQRIYQQSLQYGLDGHIGAKPNKQDEQELSAQEKQAAKTLRTKAFEEGQALRERMLPIAQELALGLPSLVNTEKNLLSAFELEEKMQPLLNIKEDLFKMSEEERSYVYHLALEEKKKNDRNQAPQQKENLFSSSWRALRRSSFNMGLDVGQAISNITAATLTSMGEGIDPILGTNMQERGKRIDKKAQVMEELRHLAQEEFYPILPKENKSLGKQLSLDVAGALPHAAMAFGGRAAFGTLMLSGIGSAIAEARQRAPQNDQELQLAAGLVGGALQAGIFKGMSRIGARVLGSSITRFSRAKGSGLSSYSLAALQSAGDISTESAKMLLAGKAASSGNLALQELAAQYEEKASQIDWESYGKQLSDIELNMREAAANLPFVLLASGRVKLRHFQSPRSLISKSETLHAWGIKDDKIQHILQLKDIDEQSRCLHQELRNSPRWVGANYRGEHMRSFRLLNTKSFQNFFKSNKIIEDFLQLPSLAKQQEAALNTAPATPQAAPINNEAQRAELAQRYKLSTIEGGLGKSLQAWDYWWQKSNLDEHLSPKASTNDIHERLIETEETLSNTRQILYSKSIQEDNAVPPRMQRRNILAPFAEQERKALLLDRCNDLHSISYQFLLNTNDIRSIKKKRDLIGEGEEKRKNLLNLVNSAVMNIFFGKSKEAALAQMDRQFVDTYLKLKRSNDCPNWLKNVSEQQIHNLDELIDTPDRDIRTSDLPVELYQATRIKQALKADSIVLYDLIPMLDDFHSYLARNYSPAKAYHEILIRELGTTPALDPSYPLASVQESKNASKFSRFWPGFLQRFRSYEELSGRKLQHTKDMYGDSLYRATYPDGSPTNWHKDINAVICEFMFLQNFMFRNFGEYTDANALKKQQERHFRYPQDIKATPPSEFIYTPFDQLCTIALNDMYEDGFNLDSIPMGHLKTRKAKSYYRASRQDQLLDPTQSLEKEYQDNYTVEESTLSNPYNIMIAKAQVYWQSLLERQYISLPEALDFLKTSNCINEDKAQELAKENHTTSSPSNESTPSLDFHLIKALSSKLAGLSADYQIAHLNEAKLPESVKLWLRTIPLYPLKEKPMADLFKTVSSRKSNLIQSINRGISSRIKAKSSFYTQLRQNNHRIAKHPLFRRLKESISNNMPQRFNRAWAHRIGGEQAINSPYNETWMLMHHPKDVWKHMDPYSQEELKQIIIAQSTEADFNFEQALANLDDCLKDYPQLCQYSIHPSKADVLLKIKLEKKQQEERNIHNSPRSKVIIFKKPKVTKYGYKIEEDTNTPERMKQDPRVRPALDLLDKLRYSISQRPQSVNNGIFWKGKLYGNNHHHLPNITADWTVRPALQPLLKLFAEIKSRCETQGSKELKTWGTSIAPLPADLDFSSLHNACVYRSPIYLNETVRLMPGDKGASILNARTPYVVRSRNGVYYTRHQSIRDDDKLDRSLLSLEELPHQQLQPHSDKTVEKLAITAAHNLIDSMLNFKMPPVFNINFGHGISDLNELLMRLTEDSGLCYELEHKGLNELMPMQLYYIRILGDLIATQFSPRPEKHFARLKQHLDTLRHNEQRRKHLELELRDMQTRSHTTMKQNIDALIDEGKMTRRPSAGRKPKQAEEQKSPARRPGDFYYDDNFIFEN